MKLLILIISSGNKRILIVSLIISLLFKLSLELYSNSTLHLLRTEPYINLIL